MTVFVEVRPLPQYKAPVITLTGALIFFAFLIAWRRGYVAT